LRRTNLIKDEGHEDILPFQSNRVVGYISYCNNTETLSMVNCRRTEVILRGTGGCKEARVESREVFGMVATMTIDGIISVHSCPACSLVL